MSIAIRHPMRQQRGWPKLVAVPILVLCTGLSTLASDVRDEAGMFSPDAIRKAKATLSRVEHDSKINVLIESVTSLNGQSPRNAVIQRGNSLRLSGMLVLIAKNEHKIEALVSNEYNTYFPSSRLQPIIDTIIQEFKSKRFDEGLVRGAEAIERSVSQAKADAGGSLRPTTTTVRNAPAPRAPAPFPAPAAKRGFGFGSVIGLILIILAIMVVVRLIGGLFGAGRGAYGPGMGPGGPMGGPGYGPGPGPGYGYGGYGGGRGGGFFSSLFGGIGGAMAGNWLYDQFTGRRHQNYDDHTYYDQTSASPPPDQPLGGQWGGNEGAGGSWDDGSGGGGGDWGGGGGGDWGGGGGGGDWGGSTGGGDWGGGGGGDTGGSW